MNRFGQILLASLFLGFIIFFGIYHILLDDIDRSDIENRNLVQRPVLSKDFLLDGTFMSQFDEYFSDQFPGRDKWLESYIKLQYYLGKTYIANHYITEDGWMLKKPEYNILDKGIYESTDKLNQLADFLEEKDIEFYYFSVPHKVSLMQFLLDDRMEKGKYEQNIELFMNRLDTDKNFIAMDMTSDFINDFSNEEIKKFFFKTDHHWNINGAFEGYRRIVDLLSTNSNHFVDKEVQVNDYEKVCFDPSVTFMGSYNLQVYGMVDASDELTCFYKSKHTDYENYQVYVDGQERNPYSIYAKAYSRDQDTINYSDIFTYNYGELKIINNENKDLDNKILIIKDSYANALVYPIAEHFYETIVYDPRYNHDRILKEYIEENDFDIVAFVYNSTHLTGSNYNFETFPVN